MHASAKRLLAAIGISLGVASSAGAAVIDFTGGTITSNDGTETTTDNSTLVDDVDFYIEDGFKFDFIGPAGNDFSYNIGDYYGVGNDVIHGHWEEGPFGDLMYIEVTKLDGTPFDLNYVTITTNTGTGGGPFFRQ